MKLQLRNDWEYEGGESWRWGAFVDGDEQDLDRIQYVEYVLHPTFVNPIRTVSDRTTKFRMETAGWGTFVLRARALMKDGSIVKLKHKIQLESEPRSGVST
jgi:transcription initiation factor IIF auxiliary subunit